MEPTLPPQISDAIGAARRQLRALYGDRLARVILFGSYARGEARAQSDVDLLVVLRGDVAPYSELRRMGAVQGAVLDDLGVFVSLHPYAEADVNAGETPLIRTATREGAEV